MRAYQKTTCYDVETGKVKQEQRQLEFLEESKVGQIKEANVIGIYPSFLYQEVKGFGCALTEAACYLLAEMDPKTRTEALKCWFGAGGINSRFIRIPIDSCDFSLSEYQAVSDPIGDPNLTTFSIERDRRYIIPIVKEACRIAGRGLSVLMSPWSPPAAWKTVPEMSENDVAVYGKMAVQADFSKPNRCFGGRLKLEYYASWARYLVKYVCAYLDEGIPVTMLSVQNEANAATLWDSCIWSAEQEKTFLKEYLYPEMKKAGLTEKIGVYIWDHNKERMVERVEGIMDEEMMGMVEGFAYHWYSGDHFDAISMLRQKYPDKVLMHSESCGLHIPGKTLSFEVPEEAREKLPLEIAEQMNRPSYEIDLEDAIAYAHDMIGDINHGMNQWIDWNMIVDRNGGPRHVPGGFAAPIVSEGNGTYTKTVSYYFIEQIATTIRPGAVRAGTSVYGKEVEAVAAKNADATIGVVILNDSKRGITATVRMVGFICDIFLPAESLTSLNIDRDS